ncbi:fibronectin type III domain-containing protein [Winogradskyella eximia]|uniref:fibronectin type III domain-containing protein n=1 Tax=Winogradskyella eximia TaxID=262006 RepID=UPI00249388D7|nr:fibronectin type III domain-containing protein [Winogradskyella eximia]
MKKILFIFTLSLTIFACTSDSPDDVDAVCLQPVGLEAYSITNTTATLNWQSAVETSEYELEYGLSGFTQGNGVTVLPQQSSYNISGLMPSTPYAYYVSLFCNSTESYSDWAGPYEFDTLDSNPLCDDPTNFIVRNNSAAIGTNHVDFKWEDFGNDGSQIQYGLQGFALETGTIQSEGNNIEDGFGTVENLESSTTYDFYVRNNCLENGFSAWIGPVTATTLDL